MKTKQSQDTDEAHWMSTTTYRVLPLNFQTWYRRSRQKGFYLMEKLHYYYAVTYDYVAVTLPKKNKTKPKY